MAVSSPQFSRKKRRRSPLLAFLILTAGISLVLAGVWQILSPRPQIEEPFEFDPVIREKYGLDSSPGSASSKTPSPGAAEGSSSAEVPESSSEAPADALEPGSSEEISASEPPVSQEPSSETAPPEETVSVEAPSLPLAEGPSGLRFLSDARPVPASERVKSTYFDDAVFIGDSITTGISLYDVMSNATVWASTGAGLTNILTKEIATVPGVGDMTILPALDAVQPGKIYILLGANSLAADLNDVIAVYSSTLDQIIAHAPNAVIYVQSAFPINESIYSIKYNRVVTNAVIDDFNSRLLELCGQKGVHFLDVNSYFRDESGGLSAESTSDGLHIHSDLYLDWFDYLKTHTAS